MSEASKAKWKKFSKQVRAIKKWETKNWAIPPRSKQDEMDWSDIRSNIYTSVVVKNNRTKHPKETKHVVKNG